MANKLSNLLGKSSGDFLGKPLALLASIKDNIGLGGRYWRWGERDNFPNIIIDSANDSGTARDCIDKLHVFTVGKGIKDKEFSKRMANPKQTWAQLDDEVSLQMSYIPAVCVRVIYDAGGRVARVYNLPIQNVRKRHDGQFIYGEELGDPQGFKMFQSWRREIIPAFGTYKGGPAIREMIAKQKAEYGRQVGELLYIYTPGVGLNYKYYPVPKWSAGLNDINADAALSLFEESQVTNSFKGSVFIETRPLDSQLKGPDGLTESERFDLMIEDASSADGGNVIHMETLGSDGAGAVITPLNIQHQMDATEKATDRIGRKVCRLFGVPPVLLGFATAGKLGDNQELVNYMKLFNLTLSRKWALKQRMYTTLFPEIPAENFETEPLELFDYVPEKVLERMTDEQINIMFKLPKPPIDEEEDKQLASRFAEFGVGGVQGILGVQQSVSDGIVSIEAGASVLEVIYGFSKEQSYVMLGGSVDDNTGEISKSDSVNREVNENLKTLTGKQQQQLDRIVRKFGKEELTQGQAVMQLTSGFGFTEEEAITYLEITEDGLN